MENPKIEFKKMSAEEVIQKLGLMPLPEEGGFYRETYRSNLSINIVSKDESIPTRLAATAIYYLVSTDGFSAMHRLKFDEIFHFYLGDPVEMLLLNSDGTHTLKTIGQDIHAGQNLQVVVPAGTWQGTRLKNNDGWALLGTTMAPAFDFADFELGETKALQEKYPSARAIIPKYVR